MAGKMIQYSPELGKLLDEKLKAFGIHAGLDKKKMFGHETWFVNSHMFASANERGIFVNVGQDIVDRALVEEAGVEPFSPMEGMVMKNYLVLGPMIYEKDALLRAWLTRSHEYLMALPPNNGKKKSATKATKKKPAAKKVVKKTPKKAAKKAVKKAAKKAVKKAAKIATKATKKNAAKKVVKKTAKKAAKKTPKKPAKKKAKRA